eukprot:CAMPEP_0184694192 /NCGR_PEP_ID=MMETSP0313-20130426/2233_1 /TAXON_ID=2792 /ORGANISM="Porphyridium aerugineum, Strain SAG 1380-2" /LENGTH=74 /DNA_ID=CAMNT_0027152443 /DNA_START=270 /DNA_END=494 /DNA_ORIENTATION=+
MAPKGPKIRGVVTYYISPFEQRIFADWFDANFVMTKMRRKITENWEWIPSFAFSFGLVTWAKAENKRDHDSHRY